MPKRINPEGQIPGGADGVGASAGITVGDRGRDQHRHVVPKMLGFPPGQLLGTASRYFGYLIGLTSTPPPAAVASGMSAARRTASSRSDASSR
jgi:hypothetical protein